MTLWEAMSMEKVVVSTNVGDVNKYVIPDYSGEVVSVGDAKGMSKKIIKLILDKEKRLFMGKQARKIIKENLDVSICAKKQYSAYKFVADKSSLEI